MSVLCLQLSVPWVKVSTFYSLLKECTLPFSAFRDLYTNRTELHDWSCHTKIFGVCQSETEWKTLKTISLAFLHRKNSSGRNLWGNLYLGRGNRCYRIIKSFYLEHVVIIKLLSHRSKCTLPLSIRWMNWYIPLMSFSLLSKLQKCFLNELMYKVAVVTEMETSHAFNNIAFLLTKADLAINTMECQTR